MTNESAILGLLAEKQQEVYQLKAYVAKLEQANVNLQGEVSELLAEIATADQRT